MESVPEAVKFGFPEAQHGLFDGGFVLQEQRFRLGARESAPVDVGIFLLELQHTQQTVTTHPTDNSSLLQFLSPGVPWINLFYPAGSHGSACFGGDLQESLH